MKTVTRKFLAPVKFALDLAPLASFVISYRLYNMWVATACIMATTIICLAIIYIHERKLALAPLITGVLVSIMGTITLVTQDEYFIKIKPTVVNLCLAAILLGGVACKKSLLKHVMEVAFQLDDEGWRTLSLRWGLFFIFLAILNEVIWRNFSTPFWVNFKLFGMLTLNILFWVVHASYIEKHQQKTP